MTFTFIFSQFNVALTETVRSTFVMTFAIIQNLNSKKNNRKLKFKYFKTNQNLNYLPNLQMKPFGAPQ